MKYRLGFVSNSSSSSFCIYGVQFESFDKAIKKFIKAGDMNDLFEKINVDFDADITTLEQLNDLCDEVGAYEIVESLLEGSGLSMHSGSEYNEECVSIGREWCDIGGEETGNQFKADVESRVARLFGKALPCSTIEESMRS